MAKAPGMFARGTESLEAWLANSQGLSEGFKFKREHNLKASDLFLSAMRLDPEWGIPVGGLAWTYREAVRRGWSDDAKGDCEKWFERLRTAVPWSVAGSICFNPVTLDRLEAVGATSPT